MKYLSLSLFQVICLAIVPAYAAEITTNKVGVLVGNEPESMISLHGVPILDTLTKKFSNGNTHVKLFPKYKKNIVGLNGIVFLILEQDNNISDDILMETLFKIQGLITYGAKTVSFYINKPLNNISMPSNLNLEHLLSILGANYILDNKDFNLDRFRKIEKAPELRNYELNTTTNYDYIVGGSNYPKFVEDVGKKLGKKAYNFKDLKEIDLKNRKIYWIAGNIHPVNKKFFETLSEINYFALQGAHVHTVFLYLPYARSDKPEFDVGVPTQGSAIATLSEALGSEGHTMMRVHAPQSCGFFTKTHLSEISGFHIFVEKFYEEDIDIIVAPDAGAAKPATLVMQAYQKYCDLRERKKEILVVVLNKQRDKNGNETLIDGNSVEHIHDKNCAIVDDETSTGGTAEIGAETLKTEGHAAKVIVAVVHLAGDAGRLKKEYVNKLYFTDTIPAPENFACPVPFEIISVAKDLALDIQRMEQRSNFDNI